MCCRLDSSASAISAGWLIAAAAHRSRSACNCLLNQAGFSKPSPRKKAPAHHGRSGLVPNAAGPWSLSNDSVPWSFAGGLRPFPMGFSHDSIFDITTAARVPALSTHVCPHCSRYGSETPEIHCPTTNRHARRQYITPLVRFLHPFRNAKYITRRFHNGFLQVAVSKTLRRSALLRPSTFSSPDRSRYSTKTYRAQLGPLLERRGHGFIRGQNRNRGRARVVLEHDLNVARRRIHVGAHESSQHIQGVAIKVLSLDHRDLALCHLRLRLEDVERRQRAQIERQLIAFVGLLRQIVGLLLHLDVVACLDGVPILPRGIGHQISDAR